MKEALQKLRAEKHISASSISTYLLCPRLYEYRYVRKLHRAHRPGALAFGSAIHSALAVFYNALKAGKQEPAISEIQTAFMTAWRKQFEGKLPVLLDDKQTPESLRDAGQAMLFTYIDNLPRPHKVVGVEEPFSIEVCCPDTGEVLPARLVGAVDVITQDEDGTYKIVEIKTASRRWSDDKLANDLQLTAYSLTAPMMGLGNAQVDVHVLLKTKEPAVEFYHPTRNESDHRDFLRVASGVIRAAENKIFFPRRDWQCRNCEFAGPCMDG